MNRKKVMVTMLAALAATSAWSDVSVMAEGTSYVEKGSAVGDIAVAVGTASEAKSAGTIAIGRAQATSGNAVAIGTDATASGSNSMALGQRATSNNTNSIAMGVGATSEGYSSTSLGEGSTAKGQDSMALGRGSHTDYWGSVAIGSGARADKANSVALGANSSTKEEFTVSVGSDTMKRRIVNVDAGRNDNDAVIMKQVFGKATADGNNTNFGNSSVAWGGNSTVLAGKHFSGAIFGGTVLDGSSLAMGYNSKTTKDSSVAVGVDATTSGVRNLALGQKAKTDQWGAIAVGSGASATAGASVAIGIESQATEENTVSVGADTRKRRIVNVDAGRNDNDVVIMKQVFGKATADGNNTNFGNSSVAWGGNSTVLAGKHFSGAIFGGTVLDGSSLAMGYNSKTTKDSSVAVGVDATTSGVRNLALGQKAKTDQWGAIAVGSGASATAGASVAIGIESQATEENTVSVGADTRKRRIVNVDAGRNDNDVVIMKQVFGKATADGNNTNFGNSSVAWGGNSTVLAGKHFSGAIFGGTVLDGSSLAMGYNSKTTKDSSVAVGVDATTSGVRNLALGQKAKTDQWGAIAVGSGASATAGASVAIGIESQATEENTVSVGADTRKRRIVNVDAGRNDNDVVIMKQVFGKATADGNNTNFGNSSVAWGGNSTVLAGKHFSGAIFGGTVLDGSSLAMGYNSKTTKDSSVAVGVDATTSGVRNLALGQKAKTDQWGAIAVGSGASATAGASVAIGIESQATEENTVSVGADTRKRRIVNVDAGRNDNDVVIMKQVFGKATADGNNTNFGNSSVAWGGNSTVLAGKHFSGAIFGGKALENQAVAVGYNAEVSANQSVALGVDSKATEEKTVSVGSDKMKRRIVNVADGKADNDAVNMKQFNEVKVKSNNAVQAGTEKGSGTQAIGAGSEANGYLSMAVGSGATTKAVNRSVAIGYGSVATDNEEFSIGNDKLTRRITHVRNGNVAEGSTDAVTGGQLWEVKKTADHSVQRGTENGFGAETIGSGSTAKGSYTLAVGSGSEADGYLSMAVGSGATTKAVNRSVAIGYGSVATDNEEFSIGNDKLTRRITHVRNGNVAEGSTDAVTGGQLWEVKKTADHSVQRGTENGFGAEAIGSGATAKGAWTLAVGSSSNASGVFSLAMGWGSQTGDNNNVVAIGHDATAKSSETVAIGQKALAQQVNAISIGNNSVAGLSDEGHNDPIWDEIGADGKPIYNTSDPNGDRRGARSGAVAVGNGAKALGYRNIAIGEDAITAKSKLKDGKFVRNAGSNNPEYTEPGVIGSIAIGGYAITEGSQSTVIGNTAYALGNHTSAYGVRSYAYGKDSSAFGNSATTMGEHSVAVGSYARADHDNSVALGSGSITDKAESTASYTKEAGKAAEYANSKTLKFAGSEAYGTVSVGGKGIVDYTGDADENGTLTGYTDPFDHKVMMDTAIYRTVTNVAAGRISETSTDAVNGSQLYYVIGKTEVNAEDIKTNAGAIGDNASAITTIQGDITDIKGDVNDIRGDIGDIRGDISDIREDVNDIRGDVRENRENIKKQEERLDQVEQNYAVQNEKINQNTNAIGDLKEQQKSIDSKLTTMDGKINGVKDDLTNYKKETDKAIAKNTEDIKKNHQAIASIKVSQQAQSKKLRNIKKQVSKAITNVQQSVTDLDTRVTKKIESHETRIHSVEETVKTHTAEIKENKENIAKNAEAIEVNKDNIAANTQSINELAQAQQQSMDGIRHAINDVRKESRQGDAMNAALAALKPLQYDPDEKTQIMAGVGGYKGEHAVALGLAHFFNDSLMANIGGAYTSGSSMIWNAGVTIKFGSSHDKEDEHRRTTIEYTPDVVVKEHIATLEQEVATSKAEMAALRASSTAQINELQKQIEELKRLLTK